MKLSTLTIALLLQGVCYGQNILYKQSNKILSYDYGVVDTAGMNKLSEIEKIKYELKFTQQSYSETIDQNYENVLEVKIDSNEYQKDWMNLSRKFKYTSAGMEIYGAQNNLKKTIAYTPEQLSARSAMKAAIQENGFHPGIVAFPEFTPQLISQFAAQNISVSNLSNGDVKMVLPNKVMYINKFKYTIVTEFTDVDGIKNRETRGYEPLGEGRGFLLKITKNERFVIGSKGQCITETKLTYYTDYAIEDNGKLMDKALGKVEQVKIYPNPNNGVFSVQVDVADNVSISSVKVINVLNGNQLSIDNNAQKTFLVNLPNLTSGQYVLQVVTSNQTVLSANFFKN